MSTVDRCSWKLVSPSAFIMGQVADRCGDIADVVVLRPERKTNLFLCEQHLNEFIGHWGLFNKIQILCKCHDDQNWNQANGLDWGDLDTPIYPLEWNDICRHGRPECECGGAK